MTSAKARLLVLGCGVAAAACSSEPKQDAGCKQSVATLELGQLKAGHFTALESGGQVSVVQGVQGGTWIMPSLRLSDAESGGDLGARLTLEDGTLLGETSRPRVRFTAADDRSLTMQFFPVPVSNEPGMPELSSVDGASAMLTLDYSRPCGPDTVQDFALTLAVVQ